MKWKRWTHENFISLKRHAMSGSCQFFPLLSRMTQFQTNTIWLFWVGMKVLHNIGRRISFSFSFQRHFLCEFFDTQTNFLLPISWFLTLTKTSKYCAASYCHTKMLQYNLVKIHFMKRRFEFFVHTPKMPKEPLLCKRFHAYICVVSF